MENLHKVIAALTGCIAGNCSNCEYGDSDCHRDELMKDALYWLKLLKEDLAGAHDEIHRLMRKGEEKEPPCAKCEYNLEMIRTRHIAYLPDTCPRRSSGECREGRSDG